MQYYYRHCSVDGKQLAKVTKTRKKLDWSGFLADSAKKFKYAEKIKLVMDNLNTHVPGFRYETCKPEKAKALLDRLSMIVG